MGSEMCIRDRILDQDLYSAVSDINEDGSVDSSDLLLIVNSIIGY